MFFYLDNLIPCLFCHRILNNVISKDLPQVSYCCICIYKKQLHLPGIRTKETPRNIYKIVQVWDDHRNLPYSYCCSNCLRFKENLYVSMNNDTLILCITCFYLGKLIVKFKHM